MSSRRQVKSDSSRIIATNRKASRDYNILEKLEAGIELRGTEVKSIRQGHISLDEGHAQVRDNQVFLHGVYILPYDHGNRFNHEPRRARRLLLHRREINRLIGQLAEKGQTLVPLKIYFKQGRVKVQLGLGKGKHHADRRQDLKRKAADREIARVIADKTKRGR